MNSSHYIIDFEYVGGLPDVESLMDNAINTTGEITVVDKFKHNFSPFGLSLIYILAESHISIHTWEEYNYISLDFYTCGDATPKNTCDVFLKNFKIKNIKKQIIERGVLN